MSRHSAVLAPVCDNRSESTPPPAASTRRASPDAYGKSYGYDVVVTQGVTDRTGERCVDEAEAEIVRRVFTLSREGVSAREIAKTLNREGVPGPAGAQWGPSTINGNPKRGTGLLNNELYIGRLVWSRLRYVKDPAAGKRRSKPNPKDTVVTKSVPHLRIVPQELWEAVRARQQQMARNTRPDRKHQEFWKHQRPRYLLSGLMKCGACGSSYTKYGKSRFTCAALRDRGTRDNRLTPDHPIRQPPSGRIAVDAYFIDQHDGREPDEQGHKQADFRFAHYTAPSLDESALSRASNLVRRSRAIASIRSVLSEMLNITKISG